MPTPAPLVSVRPDAESTETEASPRVPPRPVLQASSLSPLVLLTVIVLGCSALGYALISTLSHESADEGFHFPYIWHFYVGSGDTIPAVTQIPTYHVIMANISRALGELTLPQVRFINLLVSLISIPLVVRLTRLLHTEDGVDRALLFFLFPAIFPFFFLVYTDAWSLVALLAMVERTLSGWRLLGATMGLIAILLRQPNAVWVAFAAGLVLLEGASVRDSARDWVRRALHTWPYMVVLGAFAYFIKINDGISVGDRTNQQVGFNPSNVYYFLMGSWLFFLPEMLQKGSEVAEWLKRRLFWVFLLPLVLLLFIGTLKVTHTYNHSAMNYYLHNRFIHLIYGSMAWKILGFGAALWALIVFMRTRLADARFYFMHLAAFLSIAPLPMVEQRYYMPAWMFFIVFRRTQLTPTLLLITLALYAVASAWILFGTAHKQFFL